MLARSILARRLPARSAGRFRALSAAVELKGIGQASDLQDVVVDGITVIKMDPTAASVGSHKNLPSLPPKMHISWDYLMADLDDDAKKEVLQVKTIIERQQREIDLKRAELVGQGSIDWSSWEAQLTSPNAKVLLDGFKAEMEGWTFDPTEVNKVIDQYRADFKEMVRALRPTRAEMARARAARGRASLNPRPRRARPRRGVCPRRSCSWRQRRRSSRARLSCSSSRRRRSRSAWPT